jgi:hypothetical protein
VQNIGLLVVLKRNLSIATRRLALRRRPPQVLARFRAAAAQAREQVDRKKKLRFQQCPIIGLGLKQSTQHFREISLLGKDTAMSSEGAG